MAQFGLTYSRYAVLSAPNVHPRARHVARPIRAQSCTCGGHAVLLVTYRGGGQRVFCAGHAAYQRLMPDVTLEELA